MATEELEQQIQESTETPAEAQAPDPAATEEEALLDQIAQEVAGLEENKDPGEETKAEPKDQPPKTTKETPAKAATETAGTKKEYLSPKLAEMARAQKKAMKRLEAREAELVRKMQELDGKAGESKTLEDFKKLAIQNPAKFYKEVLGVEKTADVGRMLYLPELGDRAPEDLKRLKDRWEVEQQLVSMQKQFEEYKAQAEKERQQVTERQQWNDARSSLKEYVRELDASTAPYIVKLAKARPDQVVDALLETALLHVRENPQEDPLTPEDLVTRYEAALAEELAPFGINPKEEIEKPASKKKAGKTLTNKLATPTATGTEPQSEDELIEDIVRSLEEGRAEL